MTPQEYLKSREALISKERSLRRDSTYLSKLDATEKEAEALVRRIRSEEAASIWSGDISAGSAFLTAKSKIETSRLYGIVKKMPKGALLHVYLEATVDNAVLLELALKQPAIHIRVATKLTAGDLDRHLPEFCPLSPPYKKGVDMMGSEYVPGQWVPLKEAREKFSLGTAVFDKWVLGAMSINATEAYTTLNTIHKIWEKFSNVFLVTKGLILFAPIWEAYITKFLLSCVDDGIMYIEARINFLYGTMVGADGKDNVPHSEWLVMFDRAVKSVKATRGDEFFGAKIIYTTIRSITQEQLKSNLEDCIALKQKYPHLIAGFDLVGNENEFKPLKYYLGTLLWFKEKQKELALDIPFLFHAGETLGDGTEADDNIFDAVLLGTKRIGHGFSLVKHPTAMEMCKKSNIAIEVCPISNEILRLTSSMPMHPLPILFNNGIPVVLACDDPAVFGNLNVSYDFFQVLVSSEVSGLITLAATARDSIEFSTLDSQEKAQFLQLWQKRWMKFVKEILPQHNGGAH